jgi:RNA polymerase sigma-70 factor, ECF subfamily
VDGEHADVAATLQIRTAAAAAVTVAPDRQMSFVEDVPGISDGELIERVAARDHGAFEELHRRYARAILGLALRRIGDRGRAEDATQETFTAIWRSAERYDGTRGPGAPWLYTVARNTIVNGLRRTPEAAADAPDLAADEPGPPDRAEAAWEAWRLHRALETLPASERRVVELAYWSGLSQSEIAAFLDIPLGTVKTRVRAALRRLADTLESELR